MRTILGDTIVICKNQRYWSQKLHIWCTFHFPLYHR